jgi:pyruvate dehydrogenase E2 component (dihydrolipoamide acetyltransferase)
MATKVVMEALSPTMEEGRLVKWHKAEGEAVHSGDVLAEVETDKAIMELVARGDGVLRKQLLAEGATAPVGQLVAVVAGAAENIDALLPAQGAAPAAPSASPAPPPDPSASPPVAVTPPPAASPSRAVAPTATAPAPVPAATMTLTGPPAIPHDGEAGRSATPPPSQNGGRVRASPLARRLARARGVDLGRVTGSGPHGRVIKRDVESLPPTAAASAASVPPRPRLVPEDGDYHDVALTQIRKTIAKRLAESIGPIPTFYLTVDVDMERISDMRAAMAAQGDEFKVSVNDIIIKSVATALVQHPEVNAHWLGDHIRYFNRVHIGVAVAIDDGLITPVIFDADKKGLREIAEASRALAARARARRLTPEEYTGSTFSISNLGMLGIEEFTAIINPPETAILAVGAVEPRAVVTDGAVTIRRRMRMTMSCDHRVIDGATGARFLQTLKRLMETPLLMVF